MLRFFTSFTHRLVHVSCSLSTCIHPSIHLSIHRPRTIRVSHQRRHTGELCHSARRRYSNPSAAYLALAEWRWFFANYPTARRISILPLLVQSPSSLLENARLGREYTGRLIWDEIWRLSRVISNHQTRPNLGPGNEIEKEKKTQQKLHSVHVGLRPLLPPLQ